MPGYLISGDNQNSSQIPFLSSGDIEANNIQDAIEELDTEKASQSSISGLEDRIGNAEMITLKGLL